MNRVSLTILHVDTTTSDTDPTADEATQTSEATGTTSITSITRIVHTEYGPTCSPQRVTHPQCSLQRLNPAIGRLSDLPALRCTGRCDGQTTMSSAKDSHSLTINEDHTLKIKTSSSSAKSSGSAQGFRRLDGDGDGGACCGGTSAGAGTGGTNSTVFARSS